MISSADNKPIVGVSVYVEGTTVGATSDINGNYTLKVPAGTKHVTFAFLGYDTKKIAVADVELFKLVTLIEASNVMDDVVVVAFGTQKKESLVGAVQVVRPSTLKVTSSNLSTSFAGKIAGVISTQSSGEPGADGANFWIRGISTFGANKSPLLILDGVEIVSEMLNNIPPEAIESFSILRDATATALYGSRGANGVMIITTKNGRQSEKMAINVRLESGISMPTRVQDIADGVTYMENYNEALRTRTPAGETYVQHFSDEKITGTRNRLNPYVYPDNDWYSMLFKDFTVNENMNLNVRGGGKVVDYFLNASIFNENGILKKPAESKFNTNINSQKYLFQANVGAQLTRTTRVSLKMNTQLLFWHRPVEEVKDLFYYTMRANPVAFPAIYPKGSVEDLDDPIFGNAPSWDGGSTDINPYALLSRGYGQRHTQYITTTFSVDQDLDFVTKGLKVRGMVSFYNKTYAATYRSFSPYYYEMTDYTDNGDGTFDYNLQSIGTPGSSYLGTSTGRNGYREISLQGQIEYSRTFGKHDVNALFVYHQKEKVDNQPANDEYKVLPYREQGLAGRFTYGYDSRYLMEFNFGYNGSENFISGRRFGFFPSIAGAWVVSGEPFWEGIRSKVNLLKIRASYGLSGNDYLADSSNNIVRFPYLTTVNMNKALYVWFSPNFVKQTGHEIKTVGNPLATWEESTKLNVGLELGLFDALTLNVDVYKENRTGIFMQRRSLPSTMGLSGVTPYGNLGGEPRRRCFARIQQGVQQGPAGLRARNVHLCAQRGEGPRRGEIPAQQIQLRAGQTRQFGLRTGRRRPFRLAGGDRQLAPADLHARLSAWRHQIPRPERRRRDRRQRPHVAGLSHRARDLVRLRRLGQLQTLGLLVLLPGHGARLAAHVRHAPVPRQSVFGLQHDAVRCRRPLVGSRSQSQCRLSAPGLPLQRQQHADLVVLDQERQLPAPEERRTGFHVQKPARLSGRHESVHHFALQILGPRNGKRQRLEIPVAARGETRPSV